MPRTTTSRILAVRSDSLGDVLLTGPAVRGLALRGRVTMLCGPIGIGAAALLPGVSERWAYDAPWIAADPAPLDPAGFAHLVQRVRRGRYDEAFVFTSDRQSALPMAMALKLAGIGRVVAHGAEYPGSLLDVRVRPAATPVHEVERNLRLLDAAGVPRPSDTAMSVARAPLPAELATIPAAYVVVHPSARAEARTPSPQRWIAVVRALRAAGHAVVVTGGPSDHVARRVAVMAGTDPVGALAPVVDAVGLTSLAQMATLLAGARAVCVGNTGVMHLAAAAGAPVVALFPPTVPLERWRPWSVPHVVLGEREPACAPCYSRVCPFPSHPCADVPPGSVVDAVGALASAPQERAMVAAGAVR